FRFSAVLALRFDVHLPLASEAVEIVDEVPAHEGLDGAVHVVECDALFQNFVAIDVHKLLRHAGQESRAEAGDFRPLASRIEENSQVSGKELNIAAGAVLKNKGKATGSAHTRNGRRGKSERHRGGQLALLLVQMCVERLELLGSAGAFIPQFEVHKESGVISGANKAKQTETYETR